MALASAPISKRGPSHNCQSLNASCEHRFHRGTTHGHGGCSIIAGPATFWCPVLDSSGVRRVKLTRVPCPQVRPGYVGFPGLDTGKTVEPK